MVVRENVGVGRADENCGGASVTLKRDAPLTFEMARIALRSWEESSDDKIREVAAGARRLVIAEGRRLANSSLDLVEGVTSLCSPTAGIELAPILSFLETWGRMILF